MKISHILDADGTWRIQENDEHLNNVARLCSDYASAFGMGAYGKALGLLHDKGKESNAFQTYIRYASGYDTSERPPENHNHAYVGGILAKKMYSKGSENILVNQIISHHTGLHDTDEIAGVIATDGDLKSIPAGVDECAEKVKLTQVPFVCDNGDFNHLSRMLFSCLVDADFLDTEAFMNDEKSSRRGVSQSLESLLPMLEKFLDNIKATAADTELNRLRDKIQRRCAEASQCGKGFYSLTVPTGGGKTLSSLLWALKHAVRNGSAV